MVIQIHGFDWEVYTEQVMPAFAQWLLESDERALLALFEKTRCAYEEQFLPDPMQRLRVWPRARAFMQTLPRGPYSRREYHKLCSPLQFTALSDRYLFRHAPQLYQHSNALRSVWGAIIESYCLPWTANGSPARRANQPLQAASPASASMASAEYSPLVLAPGELVSRGELASLLTRAGLPDLAREVESQIHSIEYLKWESDTGKGKSERAHLQPDNSEESESPGTGPTPEEALLTLPDDLEEEMVIAAQGVFIGEAPNLLRLRGWLAGISIHAMALFEYLACGRRSMPFGFEASEPFGAFAGYLTPDEVWQLATCLEGTRQPSQEAAEDDYLNFRYQQYGLPPASRLIDEVQPAYASDLIAAVRKAAEQGLGLISSIE